jgi:4-hydroxy-tetrahydrodipicolinate reductase
LARWGGVWQLTRAGYALSVDESHQKTKADTSGTARAVVESLGALVAKPMAESEIHKIRNDEDSKAFGVPEDFLNGHAYHTYKLVSGDGSVTFEFKHNVNGRSTYAEGVADAVGFLAEKVAERKPAKVYDMIDVLESGKMRSG